MRSKKLAVFLAITPVFGCCLLTLGCNPSAQTEAPVRPTRPTIGAHEDTPPAAEEKTVETEKSMAAAKTTAVSFYTVEHYGNDRNADEDLKATIARATAEKKRILLQVGGEWCGWCKLLTGFIEKNDSVRSSLEKNYLLMKVTYTKEQPNEAFLSKYPAIKGYPHLFVLDSDGKLMHSQDTSPLEEGKGYNEARILAFLDEWKPK